MGRNTLSTGDRFSIGNEDKPWFTKGTFEVVEVMPCGSLKLKRISPFDNDFDKKKAEQAAENWKRVDCI